MKRNQCYLAVADHSELSQVAEEIVRQLQLSGEWEFLVKLRTLFLCEDWI
jgi:hypothetical protein